MFSLLGLPRVSSVLTHIYSYAVKVSQTGGWGGGAGVGSGVVHGSPAALSGHSQGWILIGASVKEDGCPGSLSLDDCGSPAQPLHQSRRKLQHGVITERPLGHWL